ncbi:MAG: hypothetical protein HRT90_06165 [Candidatus Margulisbacteria bacterium]|nr:hypothetical protein [Candidatus Margulisiibacteriota bacterium]
MKIEGIKNFIVQEVVPKTIWKKFGRYSIRFVDKEMISIAQAIRIRFNQPITINNWHVGGSYQYSGYRPPDCCEGAFFSDHKMLLAYDIKVNGIPAPEVQHDIRIHWKSIYRDMGITAIEDDTPTWTHVSRRLTQQNNLVIIPNPTKKQPKE